MKSAKILISVLFIFLLSSCSLTSLSYTSTTTTSSTDTTANSRTVTMKPDNGLYAPLYGAARSQNNVPQYYTVNTNIKASDYNYFLIGYKDLNGSNEVMISVSLLDGYVIRDTTGSMAVSVKLSNGIIQIVTYVNLDTLTITPIKIQAII